MVFNFFILFLGLFGSLLLYNWLGNKKQHYPKLYQYRDLLSLGVYTLYEVFLISLNLILKV